MLEHIITETENYLIINKQAGITVIPARNEPPEKCLQKKLEIHFNRKIFIVHRLDKDTSGVMLFAKSEYAHRLLSIEFEHRKVQKHYLAFVKGKPNANDGIIDIPLHKARKGKMRPAKPYEKDSLSSSTHYHLEKTWKTSLGDVSLLKVSPKTGRQHQIRVHLKYIGNPLLIDPLYEKEMVLKLSSKNLQSGETKIICSRLTLHSYQIEFTDPFEQKKVMFTALLARDLLSVYETFERELSVTLRSG